MSADTCKHVWIERYLSVSYPLRRMKINSLYGYRKDPFTGKRKFHNGIDLHARGDEVMAMMAGVVVKVGQDKSSGDGKSVDPLMVLDYIKSIREECVAALAESRETSSLSLADEKYR